MLYIVKDDKGNIVMPKEVFKKFQCHLNYRDPSGQSVQVGDEDDSSFNQTMKAAGCSVEEYNPSHD